MRFLVDTNIFLYAANRDSPYCEKARGFIESNRRSGTPWCTTWPIVYEFLRVATHRNVFSKPLSARQAIAFLDPLLRSASTTVLIETDQHLRHLEDVAAEVRGLWGSILHDAHTAVLMREHGVSEIVTADKGFKRFPFLKMVNPLAD